MATRTDLSTLKCSNATATLFRLWVQFIEDTLITTGGWVLVSDSGISTIGTMAAPTTTSEKTGWRLYRMTDALQATAPVFMRVDFGSGTAAETPAIWITLGTGSNGFGVITGIVYDGGARTEPTCGAATYSDTEVMHSYGSASTSRVQLGLFVHSTAEYGLCFSLERTRDSSGTLTGDGLIFLFHDAISGTMAVQRSNVFLFGGGSQPPDEFGLSYVLSNSNPSAWGSDVGVGIPIPMAGVALPPGTGMVIVRAADFADEAQFTVTIYGVSHTFIQLLSMPAAVGTGAGTTTSDATSRVCILFE